MNKNRKTWVAAIVILAVIFVGWRVYELREQSSGPIKIGGAFGLTGDAAAYGEAEMNATQLAIDQVNNDGGVNGRPLKLVVEDTGSDSNKTVSAVTKLLSIDGVSGVIETWADTFGSANPLFDQYNVVMLSPSASITGIQSGKFYKNSFSTYFRSDKEMEQLADKLAAAQKKNVAVIMENDPYWADVANRFIQQAQHDSLNIVENYQFNTGDSDFRDEWAKLKAKNPDAILFGSDGDDATYPLLKQRNEIYPNAPLYTAEFIEEYLPKPQYAGLMHGLTYIRPQQFANQSSTFALDYQAKFGSAAPLDASNAYDAMMILADAMIHGGLGGDAIRNYLHQNTFDTVTFGKIGFDQLGGVTETGFEMVSVK